MAVHLINELLDRLPEDCEERVHRAITEFNKLIRNQLMKETSLRLRGRRGSDNGDAAIPIRVEPGFPSALESLLQKAGRDEIEALIALFEDDLERLSSSAGEVTRLIDRLLKIERDLPECDEKYTRALADSIEVAKRLLERGVIPKSAHAALRLDCFLVDVCVRSSSCSSSAFNSARHSNGVHRQPVRRSLAIASRVCSTISSHRPDTTAARSWNTASALPSVQ